MAFPAMWGENTALVAITVKGGSDIEFASIVRTIDIDQGDKDFDTINTVRGGRLKKQTPEADTTITFEGYPVDLDTTSTDVIQRFFAKDSDWDTAQELEITNKQLSRSDFRVVILWTEDTSVSSATGAVPLSSEGLRFIAKDCQLISVKPAFTDDELKFTFKFKAQPYDSSGTSMLKWQSTDSTTTLTALSSYS